MSSLLSQPMMSPVVCARARLTASYCPPSGSLHHRVKRPPQRSRISTLPSVEPPSAMTYSSGGVIPLRADPIVCSRNRAWLKDGVTIETRRGVMERFAAA